MTFQGFPRTTGRPGTRNHLVVLSVCGLNGPGARRVAAALPGSVLIASPYGRGHVGPDRVFHRQMLCALASHPNAGAVLVLAPDDGLGAIFGEAVRNAGRPVAVFSLQSWDEDGTAMTAAAIKAGQDMQGDLARTARAPCPLSDLLVAMECGHSDASSGIVANPLTGDFADHVIAAGGAAVFSETLEWLGCETGLAARCTMPAMAERLLTLVAARHAIAAQAGHNLLIGNPGPQNHSGGITTLEEKSLGAISKGGTSPISGALAEGEPIPGPGLYAMDTPTLSPESITSMVAGGAQLVIFTTGQGNPYASALAPTIKLTGNPATAAHLPGQIDFDASPGFTGARTRADLLPELVALALRICSGDTTAAERNGDGDEVISRLGPSV
ncbi:UxaA family hydrolase [Oceaniovalibus sp. ACAM 378]|uniref:UxaA family hydrolase n=1 Tax=Oceaniovalibus sp. ACAM 378 TaxID=2599923 RepID=UPI0011D47B19|nr:UxaA family hydrolase [Oceaniovalibus sp. ACAM 378]TYB90532.1 UxaA family hydrolase [Oceaniovalibus sp. ACAM 378]